jgi:UPF0755 protein
MNARFLLKSFLYSLLVIFILFFMFYVFFLKPPSQFEAGSIKTIESGTSLRKLSRELKEEGYIKSRIAFESFVIMYGGERHLIPGEYLFKNKIPVYEVARRISAGKHGLEIVKITIPEGRNNQEIGKFLETKLPNFKAENFVDLALGREGYLFPDTYFFFPNVLEEVVVQTMKDNFEKKTLSIRGEISKVGKNEKEIITMASILEREAKGDQDREQISGILWKRLSIGMALQVDAAPETYKERGLPDSPIGNPGLESIYASLYPKTTPYLYYLHDKQGMIHYARSFAEHKANIAKYLK